MLIQGWALDAGPGTLIQGWATTHCWPQDTDPVTTSRGPKFDDITLQDPRMGDNSLSALGLQSKEGDNSLLALECGSKEDDNSLLALVQHMPGDFSFGGVSGDFWFGISLPGDIWFDVINARRHPIWQQLHVAITSFAPGDIRFDGVSGDFQFGILLPGDIRFDIINARRHPIWHRLHAAMTEEKISGRRRSTPIVRSSKR